MTDTAHQWIDQLDQLPDSIKHSDLWYLDTEFIRERTFWAKLALVQIKAKNDIVLLDAPSLTDTASLGNMIRHKTLVLHACSEDLEVLSHSTGQAPLQIRDTQVGAALAGFSLQLSYQKLVEEICAVSLAKEATRSDWLARPLSPQQLNYAADDVRYLDHVYHWLTDKLAGLNRLDWWQEESTRLQQNTLRQTPPHKLWRHVKGASNLAGDETTRLMLLADWRNQQARTRDLPMSFVIKDEQLMALAQRAPTKPGELQTLGLHPGLVQRHGNTLLALMQQAKTLAPPAPLPGPLTPDQKALYKKWKALVDQAANAWQLESNVLMRRKWLEALVRHPDRVPEPLTGWRHQVITQTLLDNC